MKMSAEAMLSHVFNLLMSPFNQETKDGAELIAQKYIDLEEQREITRRAEIEGRVEEARQHTRQMEILASAFLQAVDDGDNSNQTALDLLKGHSDAENAFQVDDGGELNHIEARLGELEARINSEGVISEFDPDDANVTADENRKLYGQVRKMIPDISQPLGSSADNVTVNGFANDNPVGFLDEESARSIRETIEDALPTPMRGDLRSYDKDNGSGKFVNDDYPGGIPYHVPGGVRADEQPEIIDAMQRDETFANFTIVRDAEENPVRLIFENIIDDDD
ncbi:MAG: hypothetical protein ACFE0S_01630 [Rhodospirillales bacterium]